MIRAPFTQVIEKAAEQLGLEVRQGQEAFELSYSRRMLEAADEIGREALKKAKSYQDDLERTRVHFAKINEHLPIASFLDNVNAAMGQLDGDTIFLLPEVKSKSETLHLALMFAKPQQQTLYLFPQRWYHNLASAVFGLEDIQLGDSQLDPLVIIRAADSEKAAQLLRQPEVSRALLDLFSDKEVGTVVNDLSVRMAVSRVPSPEEIVTWVKRMQTLSQALS